MEILSQNQRLLEDILDKLKGNYLNDKIYIARDYTIQNLITDLLAIKLTLE